MDSFEGSTEFDKDDFDFRRLSFAVLIALMNLLNQAIIRSIISALLLLPLTANAAPNAELVKLENKPASPSTEPIELEHKSAAPTTALIELEHRPVAPRFSLPDMQDKNRELSDYLGKPVIISFWATWCPPCRKEIPYFNRAREKLKDDNVVMLFVNINESKETIEEYIKKVPINLTILRDETAGQLTNWNITGLPTTFILDPEGQVAYQAMGERIWDSGEILDKVRALKN